MKNVPYWIDTMQIGPFPPLRSDLEVDVLVVGGGVTGVTTAYLLQEAGLRIALIEREGIASIDTGHTTAHLTYVTDTPLQRLVKRFGPDHARAVWDAGAAAIDEIERVVNKEKIECRLTRVPGYFHESVFAEPSESDRAEVQQDAKLAQELGFDAIMVKSVPVFNVPGVRFADQAEFHPRKYLGPLAAKIVERGADVFEKSSAEEFDSEKRRVKVNGHWITFDRLILATNNPLVGLSDLSSATVFQTKLSLYSSYALGARIPRDSLPIALFWDTADPYNYLRVHRDDDFDYAIFGGEDHKTGQVTNTENCYGRLVMHLKKFAPEAQIEHRWSGQVIETNDGLPFIGENAPGQFIATGFCGNGITFGTVSAMMARDWATGRKNPWRDLFDVDRKVIRGGAWDYVKENADYPYYMIKDRLARAEGDSVRELERNSGMILKLNGKKIAAYRDSNGEVQKRSAICPHLGCIVRWNSAESTWDCPCHGSRFKPTGEVIAGPAESPLAQV